jgi:hypothetical protein
VFASVGKSLGGSSEKQLTRTRLAPTIFKSATSDFDEQYRPATIATAIEVRLLE